MDSTESMKVGDSSAVGFVHPNNHVAMNIHFGYTISILSTASKNEPLVRILQTKSFQQEYFKGLQTVQWGHLQRP
jgi:hypothetical protein